jgi:cysteine desulfurase
VGARESEIVFTSGATESNNLALDGLADHFLANGRQQILVCAIEHPSVLAPADRLERRGFQVRRVPVGPDGRLDLVALSALLEAPTALVSVAGANHEIGTVQPLARISTLVRGHGALLHADLAQAAGKIPIDAADLDLASLSAHKLGGPFGVGALYIARELRGRFRGSIAGGGQEGRARSGTLSPPLCIAFGAACEIATRERAQEAERIGQLKDRLYEMLHLAGGVQLHGPIEDRLPGNLNLGFDDVDGEALVLHVRDALSISTGSACTATSLEPSPVLLAIGLGVEAAEQAIRIGLGRATTPVEVEAAGHALIAAVQQLRATRRRQVA